MLLNNLNYLLYSYSMNNFLVFIVYKIQEIKVRILFLELYIPFSSLKPVSWVQIYLGGFKYVCFKFSDFMVKLMVISWSN